jgi:MFS family permease
MTIVARAGRILGFKAALLAENTRGPIPPAVRRNLGFIAVAQALVGAGGQLTPSLGAIIAKRLSGSDAFIGVATSLTGLSRMLVSYPIGSFTDRHGRKAGLALGLVVAMIGTVLTGSAVLLSSFRSSSSACSCLDVAWVQCNNCESQPLTCSRPPVALKVSGSC